MNVADIDDQGRSLATFYARLILVLAGISPCFAIAYLYYFQSPELHFSNHLFHEIAIATSIAQSAFIAWVSWRCYQHTGEIFLRWLTIGFYSFTIIYAFHGLFTRLADHNLWQFILFGPVSRFAMSACFFIGLSQYTRPPHDPKIRAGSFGWIRWTVIFLLISAATFLTASTPIAPIVRLTMEIAALLLFLGCIGMILIRRHRSGLLALLAISLLFFAQSCLSFLLGKAWDHQWWLAHSIFAAGFIGLSFGVLRAYLTTHSFANVFSQEQLMEQIRMEKARTEEAYFNLHDAHRKLRDSSLLLSNVLDAASEFSIIATDTNGTITIFNHGAEKLLGYSAEEVVNRATPEIIHIRQEVEERARELQDELGYAVTGFRVFVEKPERDGTEAREWTYVRKNGEHIPVSLVVTAMRNSEGQLSGYLGIATDISERQRLERAKREFMATLTHELRTPITSISGALDLASNRTIWQVPEKAGELLDIAKRNSQRLLHLINDFLDIEKIAAGKLPLDMQWHAIGSIIEQAIEANRTYSGKHHIELAFHNHTAAGDEVLADSLRFEQVLSNLLSNAVKFSPEGSCVDVEASTSDKRVRITVSDHGPGIPVAFRDSIFKKFSQADNVNSTGSKKGSGLGLAISRDLVEYMGGRIGFDTEEGQGTCFWVELSARRNVGTPFRPAEAKHASDQA